MKVHSVFGHSFLFYELSRARPQQQDWNIHAAWSGADDTGLFPRSGGGAGQALRPVMKEEKSDTVQSEHTICFSIIRTRCKTGSCLVVFVQSFVRPVLGSYNRALELWGAGSKDGRRKIKGALFTGRWVMRVPL